VADSELVAAAQAGDRVALDELLRNHYDKIHALCRRLTGNESDALDATQEALIAVVRGLPRFDGRAAFSTWLYRVATNACLDELRRRRRRPPPVDDGFDTATAGSAPPVDQSVADRLAIDEALGGLAEDFRVAVILRDVVGLDYAEIATTLDIPPGTVRSRIARGRAELARRLGNPSDDSSVRTEVP
jgi:RNA polymerase sigma-70 factor (ECF subfamily)